MNKRLSITGQLSNTVLSTSSSKRRSLKGGPDLPEDIPQNDDEAEREQRQKRNSGKFGQLAGVQVSLGGLGVLSASELVAQYSNCIRLSAENKINHKNAFSLPLIDCMKLLLKKKDEQMNNFQVVGVTLDASAKIYASRVDRVHMDGMSFAKDLGGRAHLPASKNTESGEDEPYDENEPLKKKKKYRKKIVCKDSSKINISLDATEPDPTYVVLSKQFSNCQPSFVSFIPRLNIMDDSCKVFMDMKRPFLSKEEDTITYKESDVEFDCSAVLDENCQIVGPPFRDIMAKEVEEIDYDSLLNATTFDDTFGDDELVGDQMDDDSNDPFSNPCNENTMVNGDGAVNNNDFSVVKNNSTWNGDQEISTRVRGFARDVSRDKVVDLQEVILNQVKKGGNLEYTYMNLDRILFAGPGHWRALPISKVNSTSLKTADGKKKKEKKLNYMNFSNVEEVHIALSRACVLTTSYIENNWTIDKVTPPVNLHLDPKSLIRYFNRPLCMISITSGERNETVLSEEDGNVYDYDNLNDSQQYCPAPELGPECDNDNSAGENENGLSVNAAADVHSLEQAESGSDAWSMVDPPNKVARLAVPFAQQAKKIDMKALKTAIWKVLYENEQTMENGAITPSQKKRKNNNYKHKNTPDGLMMREMEFSIMERRVMNLVSSSMAQDLTMPLIFNALLHLANEKTLILRGVEDHSDIFIFQDSGAEKLQKEWKSLR